MSRKKKKRPMAQPPQPAANPPEPTPDAQPLPAPLRLLEADYSRLLRTRNVRWLIVIAAVIGALWLGSYLSAIFVPLLVALGIAYILNPLVVRLQKRGLSRVKSVLFIFLLFIAVGVSAGVWFTTSVVRDIRGINTEVVAQLEQFRQNPNQWKESVRELPFGTQLVENVDLGAASAIMIERVAPTTSALETPEQQQARAALASARSDLLAGFRAYDKDASLKLEAGELPPAEIKAMDTMAVDGVVDPAEWFARFGVTEAKADKRSIAPEVIEAGQNTLSYLGSSLLMVLTIILFVVLVPIYTWYFMVGYDSVVAKAREYLPGRQRERFLRIGKEIDSMMRGFFRGRIIVVIIMTVVSTIVFLVFGVEYAVLLGLLTGIGVLIPYFSILAAWIPALLLMVVAQDSVGAMVGMSICFHVLQAVEQYYLTPKLLGNAVQLHPVTLLVGVFVMGSLLGIFGALLAVPLTAIAKTLGREFLLPYFKSLAEEKPGGA